MRRMLVILCVLTSWVVVAASPAEATAPTIWREHFEYTTPQPYGMDCGSFEVLFTASAEHLWMDFYDKAGNVVQETVHFSFTGTLYNSVTKASIPYEGHGFWIWNYKPHSPSVYEYRATVDGKNVPFLVGSEMFRDGSYVFHGINAPDVICEALS